ncbi:MAG TPA: ATPase, T2SS/T4P/T4SS family, partial [Solirubrobacteraceae bacterium]
MALKDRLDARRHKTGPQTAPGESGLTVIPGTRPEAAPAPAEQPADTAQKTTRQPPSTLSAAKVAIHALLVERHAHEIDITDRKGVRSRIASLTDEYAKSSGIAFSRLDYGHVIDALLDEVLGLGPLQALLEDAATTEIMVNHPGQIYVERAGRVSLSPIVFESEAQLRQVIDRIVSTVGRRVDESSPMVDARLRDGSRVNVIIPPLAIDGPCMTIRKFSRDKLRPSDLMGIGTATPEMIEFLRAAVRSRLSILVSGGTSSGKTTLLNILSSFIPSDERV